MKYLTFTLLFAAACSTQPPGESAAPKAKPAVEAQAQTCATCDHAAPSYFYSPFVVRLAGGHHFKSVSFKDVGLKRATPTPDDPLLEVIAESVAIHLSESPLNVEAEVSYDPSVLDPSNHVACGSDRLYVDVWRSGEDKMGYSLWSGCCDDDNFAWAEVPATFNPADLPVAVDPLAASIIESLATATQKSCFQKSC